MEDEENLLRMEDPGNAALKFKNLPGEKRKDDLEKENPAQYGSTFSRNGVNLTRGMTRDSLVHLLFACTARSFALLGHCGELIGPVTHSLFTSRALCKRIYVNQNKSDDLIQSQLVVQRAVSVIDMTTKFVTQSFVRMFLF